MKILLVEDQLDKKENILNFIESAFPDFEVSDCTSLRGALREVVSNDNYSLILLDMSMPAFDPSESYMDDSPESYAGMELMEQMKLRSISIPVIVVTQFSSFEGGSVALDGLSSNFASKYSGFYHGYVYYDSANENWKGELEARIKSLTEN